MKKTMFICLFFLVMKQATVFGVVVFPGFAGWELKEDTRVYTGKDLWELIDGAADIFLSYDFKDLRIAEYSNKDQIIRVELYRESTPENAYGIYSAERMPDYPQVTVGSQGYRSEGVLNFLAGDYYVKIMSAGAIQAEESAIATLAAKINEMLAQPVGLPEALKLFPEEGLELLSDNYIAQNFLGYQCFHTAYTAKYKRDAEFQLFIIKDTPEELGHMLTAYASILKVDKLPMKDKLIIAHDPFNGTIFMMMKSDYLVGVLNTEDEAVAADYINRVMQQVP
jgi:hypothetical protein